LRCAAVVGRFGPQAAGAGGKPVQGGVGFAVFIGPAPLVGFLVFLTQEKIVEVEFDIVDGTAGIVGGDYHAQVGRNAEKNDGPCSYHAIRAFDSREQHPSFGGDPGDTLRACRRLMK
jgi:hypothetical protein